MNQSEIDKLAFLAAKCIYGKIPTPHVGKELLTMFPEIKQQFYNFMRGTALSTISSRIIDERIKVNSINKQQLIQLEKLLSNTIDKWCKDKSMFPMDLINTNNTTNLLDGIKPYIAIAAETSWFSANLYKFIYEDK